MPLHDYGEFPFGKFQLPPKYRYVNRALEEISPPSPFNPVELLNIIPLSGVPGTTERSVAIIV